MAAVPEVGRADTEVSSRTTHHLYEQYGRQVYAFCLNRLRSREEAEDAVQTTFLNAFRALQKGTQTRFEQAWLYKIAHHVCLERSQSSGRRLQVESPSDLHVLQEVASAHAPEDPEQLLGVEDALAGMPASQRKAILLREWQGLSYREIGEELGISQSSVEMLIFRARRSLARALEEPQVAERKKARGGRVLNLGSFVTGLKTLLTGGTAVKMAAVAVTAGTVIAAGAKPVVHSILSSDAHGRPQAAAVQHGAAPPMAVVDVTPSALLRPAAHHSAPAQKRSGAMLPAAGATKKAHPAHVLSAPFTPVATSAPTPTTTAAAATPPPPIVDTQPTAQASGPVVTPTSAPGPTAPPASKPTTAPTPTNTPTPTNGNGGNSTGSGGAKSPKSGDGTGSGSPNVPPTQTNPQTPQQPGTPTDQPTTQGTGNGDPKGGGHGRGRRGHGDGNRGNDPNKNQNQDTGSGQSPNVGTGQGATTTPTTTTGQTSTTPTSTTPTSTTPNSTKPASNTPTSTTPTSTTPASTTPQPAATPASPPPPAPGNGGGDGNGHGGYGHGHGH